MFGGVNGFANFFSVKLNYFERTVQSKLANAILRNKDPVFCFPWALLTSSNFAMAEHRGLEMLVFWDLGSF